MTNSENLTPADCLDADALFTGCSGDVEYRFAMSPTGISYPRCDKHHGERVERQRGIVRDYGGQMDYTGYEDRGWADESWDY